MCREVLNHNDSVIILYRGVPVATRVVLLEERTRRSLSKLIVAWV